MVKRDFVSIADLSPERFRRVIVTAVDLKRRGPQTLLAGKSLALLFQKPSLRTRVSFDIAMHQLGGHCLYLAPEEVGLGKREAPQDIARVLSRYVSIIAARTFAHRDIELLAKYATVPVINALSDHEHPCQAMADLLTVHEKLCGLQGRCIAFLGDGNNVAASLAMGAALGGAHFRIASPKGYELSQSVAAKAAEWSRGRFEMLRDPVEAVRGADVVYTDVWTSMGQESQREQRLKDFHDYQVTPQLLAKAKPGALFMHPLPAHHGEEVAAGVVDLPQSVVFDQAENRLHVQKSILLDLLGAEA